MKAIIENINQILSEWDPIEVGKNIAIDEYRGYIPIILKSISNKESLMSCISEILINKMGLNYNLLNTEHVKELDEVCERIIQSYNNIV